MSSAPSDWEQGVLDAARWMREHPGALAEEMVRSLRSIELEGTERRVVRQIVQWMREQRFGQNLALENGEQAARRLASGIESYDWRIK